MKICLCCGHASDALTCPRCGEASWIALASPGYAVPVLPISEPPSALVDIDAITTPLETVTLSAPPPAPLRSAKSRRTTGGGSAA